MSLKRVFSISPQQHGTGKISFEWQNRIGQFMASVGSNNSLYVFNRHGELIDALGLQGECVGLEWTDEGDLLAVAQGQTGVLLLWDANTRKVTTQLETSMKGINILKWSRSGDVLATGTNKGNLLLYDRRSGKKIPILGKHTRCITTAAWSSDSILACGSEDKTFTLSNIDGDTILQVSIKDIPTQMKWSFMKTGSNMVEPVLSMVLGEKTLYFHSMRTPESPIELAFQSKYGSIVAYQWFGEGYLAIGFSSGYFVVVSTSINEIGQELFQARDHKDILSDIFVSPSLGKLATCGDNCIKIHDLMDPKDIYAIISLDEDRGQLDHLRWSDDGQFVSVSTKTGSIHNFLAKLPMLSSICDTSVMYLTGLLEVTISDQSKITAPKPGIGPADIVFKQEIPVEPTVLALGPGHMAVGMNNRCWFYALKAAMQSPPIPLTTKRPSQVGDRSGDRSLYKEYLASIKNLCLNNRYCAATLSDGCLHIHSIENDGSSLDTLKVLPEKEFIRKASSEVPLAVTCAAITHDFIVYGTNNGLIHHYSNDDWVLVNEIKHKKPIQAIYPCPRGGTRMLFRDDDNDLFVLSPTSDAFLQIPGIAANNRGILWECGAPSKYQIFVSWDDDFITTFAYNPFTLKGQACISLGTTRLPFGLKPLLLLNGALTCQTQGGKLTVVNLATHELIAGIQGFPEEEQGKALQLYYMLGKQQEIWSNLSNIPSPRAWKMLAESMLHVLDIQTATRVYRQKLHDAGMVTTLNRISEYEDKNLLAGHICVALRMHGMAQEFFLASSYPQAALELRRNLLQWDQAMNLATKLAPHEITTIAKEYAQQLEFNGKYPEAHQMYQKALESAAEFAGPNEVQMEHQIHCTYGLIRMTFCLGDILRGMKMLAEVKDRQLLYDCGMILENLKQWVEAGMLYERSQYWEKAAEVYIKAKSWNKVGNLLGFIHTPKIHIQYARSKEAEGRYEEAARAYEKAKDWDNVVRLFVEQLKNIDGAVSIVRNTRSRESAKLVAKFFQSIKDYKSVVEFYLVSGMQTEAFELAQQHDVMDHYAELVKDDATAEMLMNIAAYFESKGQLLSAGKYYLQAGNYSKAMKMFLESPSEDGVSVDYAIQTVGVAKSDLLTHQLIDFLMGETDGVPKDAKYIFKLYMSLGQFKEAARTAIIIAREEQTLGNYRAAHDLLLDNFRQLKLTKTRVPSEIERMLMILHSYILVKTLVKLGDHTKAARMLIRVSNNISKFPAHVVPILTSTVIECQRAGLKKEAFEFAAMLMRREYRQKVDAKYKKKIEQIIRQEGKPRPEKDESIEETSTPCPFCSNPVPESVLDCIECKNHLPYCIATGRHMVASDWSQCPRCEFPALFSEFVDLVGRTGLCPMCSNEISAESIRQAGTVPKEFSRESLASESRADDDADDGPSTKSASGLDDTGNSVGTNANTSMEHIKPEGVQGDRGLTKPTDAMLVGTGKAMGLGGLQGYAGAGAELMADGAKSPPMPAVARAAAIDGFQ
ncbi:uncharacterized protein BJ171DRAFT_597315 [Polychytrium aggregatum]|uniref:uncharacterized protein n=1 Tax=Polychytrium aggregatum TaxID=110093 RepID=UPI0022FEB7B0|nr:uncharacterized protein BJ171DRAFT_597315 [Polychytrium aggregatum]KAI9206652.1 hypothetical protein BJ171DRAFT_597315 [Polychytrium aggregatum]